MYFAPEQSKNEEVGMNPFDFFSQHVTDELIKHGFSLESLKREYKLTPPPVSYSHIESNAFLLSSDDIGAPCLIEDEYREFHLKVIQSFDKKDVQFVLDYLQSHTSDYHSPRRGSSKALRGNPYYRLFKTDDSALLVEMLKNDLQLDISMFNLLARAKSNVPKELVFMVIEYVKNTLFKIMYAYIEKSLREESFFDINEWNYLDRLAKDLWELHATNLFREDYAIASQLPLYGLFGILTKLDDGTFNKLRELDSTKTLMRLAASMSSINKKYDFCIPLLYGGIEMPYALYGYSKVYSHRMFSTVMPLIFSFNRVKKGVIPSSVFTTKGLLSQEGFGNIIPQPLLNQLLKQTGGKVLLMDNNFTTGYSARVIKDSLESIGFTCDLCIAEINLQEINGICEHINPSQGSAIMLRGNTLVCDPVCEYVTCFGLNDRSRVVNRIKFLLGEGGYYELTGYDFDETIVKTGCVHKDCWEAALKRMGIDIDLGLLPNNSGLTFEQATFQIYDTLINLQRYEMHLCKKDFAKYLSKYKLEEMKRYDLSKISIIAKTINMIKNSHMNMQIVVSNNKLDFVRYVLEGKDLLKYFSFLICEDGAYAVNTQERIALRGQAKPSTEGFLEAAEYFRLPNMKTYIGDHIEIDRLFAEQLGCEFTMI